MLCSCILAPASWSALCARNETDPRAACSKVENICNGMWSQGFIIHTLCVYFVASTYACACARKQKWSVAASRQADYVQVCLPNPDARRFWPGRGCLLHAAGLVLGLHFLSVDKPYYDGCDIYHHLVQPDATADLLVSSMDGNGTMRLNSTAFPDQEAVCK